MTSERVRNAVLRRVPGRILVAGLVLASAACSPVDGIGSTRGATVQEVGTVVTPAPRSGPFTRASVWKSTITTAPRARDSARMVAHLSSQLDGRYGGVAGFNVFHYNASFYSVSGDFNRTTVTWDDCQGKGAVPDGLYGPGGQFVDVPIPSDAVPAAGSDASLTVYQPSTDTMWDFWRAVKRPDGWHACWGGRLRGVSRATGYFAGSFGASASGLSLVGGAIGIREAQAGVIDHALALAIPNPAGRHRISWPAQRSDGFDPDPAAIPEGTRLRLDPQLKLRTLKLHPLARMVARAAQRYGFIVTDKSSAVAVITESGAAAKASTGVDPWLALMAGTPDYLIMKNFPWDQLQALPRNYGKPHPRRDHALSPR